MNYWFVQLIILFVLFSNSRTDQDIQTYTIAVINALFLKAPEEKRQVRLHFLTVFHNAVSFTWCIITSAFLYCKSVLSVFCIFVCIFVMCFYHISGIVEAVKSIRTVVKKLLKVQRPSLPTHGSLYSSVQEWHCVLNHALISLSLTYVMLCPVANHMIPRVSAVRSSNVLWH